MQGKTESEWQTRKRRIDTKLRELGWEVVPHQEGHPTTNHAVCEYPTDNGPADYALFSEGKLLGIIEAKKLSLGPQNALVQAERYSKGASGSGHSFGPFHVPFLYSTNGEVIWFRDARSDLNLSREVKEFHTPGGLGEHFARDFEAAADRLEALENNHPRLRYYQKDANTAVERAIIARKRLMMLAMATGVGKTFTTVNQVYRLLKSGVAKRVLFLVDRTALAAQTVRAFSAFEPEPGLKFDNIYEVYSQRFHRGDMEEDGGAAFDSKVLPNAHLANPNASHTFVYVCTIQRMAINLLGREGMFEKGDDTGDDDDSGKIDIPIHAFDVIIADECHRGYSAQEQSIWRTVLNHFDAVKIGLTATPAAHTIALFKEKVYEYGYRQAVTDGYLVDYNAVSVKSKVRINGIFLRTGESVDAIDLRTGMTQRDFLEDERKFDSSSIERDITSPDSNRKIVEELKKYALDHEKEYGRFPKTLIFASNDLPHISHADQLVTLCREVFGRGESFVQKITGSSTVDRPLQRIREFRNRPNPAIVVTVDMLSTGVDIPDLEYIVFLRFVKSRILFEQMLGRGTRRGDRHPDKSHFTVFDCFDGGLLKYFVNSTGITSDPPVKPSKPIAEVIDDIWNNANREYNEVVLVKRLHRIDKQMSGKAREQFAVHIPDGDVAKFAVGLQKALKSDFTETMRLLRDPSFQKLLEDYPRAPRVFIRATDTQDEVTSEWVIRDGLGKAYKPEDYLVAFEKYIRDNPDHVEAIRILLDRPRDWGTEALNELRRKLAANTLRFTEDNLRKVHRAKYGKSLVDIISMVRHAADHGAPLLTAEERVDAAIARLFGKQPLSDDASKWLTRIREHLVANLSIDREDFEDVPVLSREGGWSQANRAFGGKLKDILVELNGALAA